MSDRLRRWLSDPAHSYWKLLIWWPFYLIAYGAVGRLGGRVPAVCSSLPLDYRIPYVPGFIIPYLAWFPYWIGPLLYGFLREPRLFRRLMSFFMLTFTTAVFIFWFIPTYPGLRPEPLEGRGLCRALTRFVYWIDADTNACPSEHIVGIFATLFAVWDSDRLSRPWIKVCAVVIGIAIAASTLLVRQHAVLDVAAAAVLSGIGWVICFRSERDKGEGKRNSCHP